MCQAQRCAVEAIQLGQHSCLKIFCYLVLRGFICWCCLKLRLFGHTLLLYRQVLVFLIALLPLPTPGKKGGWGPAVASPRCEVPRPAKGWLSLVTLFRPTFERYGVQLAAVSYFDAEGHFCEYLALAVYRKRL